MAHPPPTVGAKRRTFVFDARTCTTETNERRVFARRSQGPKAVRDQLAPPVAGESKSAGGDSRAPNNKTSIPMERGRLARAFSVPSPERAQSRPGSRVVRVQIAGSPAPDRE
jgi:hypothetical protein